MVFPESNPKIDKYQQEYLQKLLHEKQEILNNTKSIEHIVTMDIAYLPAFLGETDLERMTIAVNFYKQHGILLIDSNRKK